MYTLKDEMRLVALAKRDDIVAFEKCILELQQQGVFISPDSFFLFALASKNAVYKRDSNAYGHVAAYVFKILSLSGEAAQQNFMLQNIKEIMGANADQPKLSYKDIMGSLLELPNLQALTPHINNPDANNERILDHISNNIILKVPTLLRKLFAADYKFSRAEIISLLQLNDLQTSLQLQSLFLIKLKDLKAVTARLQLQGCHEAIVTLYAAFMLRANSKHKIVVQNFRSCLKKAAIDWDKDYYLHIAAKLGYGDLIQGLLREELADPNQLDRGGKLAIDLTISHEKPEAYRILKKYQVAKKQQESEAAADACNFAIKQKIIIADKIHLQDPKYAAILSDEAIRLMTSTAVAHNWFVSLAYVFGHISSSDEAQLKFAADLLCTLANQYQNQYQNHEYKKSKMVTLLSNAAHNRFGRSIATIVNVLKYMQQQLDAQLKKEPNAAAITVGETSITIARVKEMCSLDFVFPEYSTALELAVKTFDVKLVLDLLQFGVNPNFRTNHTKESSNRNPLSLAMEIFVKPNNCSATRHASLREIIYLLIAYGAKFGPEVACSYVHEQIYNEFLETIAVLHLQLKFHDKEKNITISLPPDMANKVTSYLVPETLFIAKDGPYTNGPYKKVLTSWERQRSLRDAKLQQVAATTAMDTASQDPSRSATEILARVAGPLKRFKSFTS